GIRAPPTRPRHRRPRQRRRTAVDCSTRRRPTDPCGHPFRSPTASRYRRRMAFDPGAVGRAFSEHRFDEALPHLAKNVRWTIVGYMVLEGADAVRQTCRDTLESLEAPPTTFDRCVIAAGSDAVAVDTF